MGVVKINRKELLRVLLIGKEVANKGLGIGDPSLKKTVVLKRVDDVLRCGFKNTDSDLRLMIHSEGDDFEKMIFVCNDIIAVCKSSKSEMIEIEQIKDAENKTPDEIAGRVLLRSGKSKIYIPYFTTYDNPYGGKEPRFEVEIGGSAIESLQRVVKAASMEEVRPALTGVYFDIKNNAIVATDSITLIQETVEFKATSGKHEDVIISKDAIELLCKTIQISDTISLTVYESCVSFSTSTSVFITRLISGDYPAYQRIIPNIESKINIDMEEFKTKLNSMIYFANPLTHLMALEPSNDKKGINIKTENPLKSLESSEFIECTWDGEPVEIALNIKKTLFLLNSIKGEGELHIYAKNKPIRIKTETQTLLQMSVKI